MVADPRLTPTHRLRLGDIEVSINLHYQKTRPNRTTTFKFVRRIARKFQARPYVVNPITGHGEHINLGMWETEEAAAQVVRDFLKTGRKPARVCRSGSRPTELLPKYVRRTAAGKYVGVVRLTRNGPVALMTEPMDDPDETYQEIRKLILATLGPKEFPRFFPFG